MFTFPISRRQNDRPNTRGSQARRRGPLVETLEGRQLLSTVTAADVTKNSPAIVGQHIGMAAAVQGAHIGTNAAVTNTIACDYASKGLHNSDSQGR